VFGWPLGYPVASMIGSRQAEGLGSFSFSCSFVSYWLMNIGDDQPPAQHAYSEDQMCSRDRIHNHKDNEGCDGMNTRPVSPCPTRVAPVVSSVMTCISSPTSSRLHQGVRMPPVTCSLHSCSGRASLITLFKCGFQKEKKDICLKICLTA
jgi:hypothetical protein